MILDFLRTIRRRERAYSVGARTRVYAVGDIHGRADLLQSLVARIRTDLRRGAVERKVLVYIGDYVDRGMQSREVIDYLLSDPAPEFETVYLKGNHEAWMLDFLEGKNSGLEWFNNGGQATLLSYGVRVNAEATLEGLLAAARDQLAGRLPEAHLAFLKDLKLVHTEGDYVFAHAGIRRDEPLATQGEQDLLWIREEFTEDDADYDKCVVHGHTVSKEPEVRRNRIGIDTGAYATGRLTCLVLEGGKRRFLDSG